MVSVARKIFRKLPTAMAAFSFAALLSFNVMAAFGTDFLDALDAIEEGDFQKAITKLEKAIKSRDDAGLDQRFYGMVYGNYIPHFYLGQAHYQLGDCEGAMDAWNESLRQGVITGLNEYSTMQAGMTACAGEVVDIPKLAGEATRAIDNARSRSRQLEGLSSDFRDLGSDQLYQREWVARWEPALRAGEQSTGDMESRLGVAVDARDDTTIQAIKSEATELANTDGRQYDAGDESDRRHSSTTGNAGC